MVSLWIFCCVIINFLLLLRCHFFVFQKATKWSERKESVSELTKLASTKRIASGDFSEVCRTLKKVFTSPFYFDS